MMKKLIVPLLLSAILFTTPTAWGAAAVEATKPKAAEFTNLAAIMDQCYLELVKLQKQPPIQLIDIEANFVPDKRTTIKVIEKSVPLKKDSFKFYLSTCCGFEWAGKNKYKVLTALPTEHGNLYQVIEKLSNQAQTPWTFNNLYEIDLYPRCSLVLWLDDNREDFSLSDLDELKKFYAEIIKELKSGWVSTPINKYVFVRPKYSYARGDTLIDCLASILGVYDYIKTMQQGNTILLWVHPSKLGEVKTKLDFDLPL